MHGDPIPIDKAAFSIDLNEAPPSPLTENPSDPTAEPYSFASKFHGDLTPEEAPAAAFPGEAGVGGALTCGVCGKLEVWGGTVVCDGCESGFHLGCLRPRQREQVLSGDWVCGGCALSGPLLGSEKLLDINEPPPGDDDCAIDRQCAPELDIFSCCCFEKCAYFFLVC